MRQVATAGCCKALCRVQSFHASFQACNPCHAPFTSSSHSRSMLGTIPDPRQCCRCTSGRKYRATVQYIKDNVLYLAVWEMSGPAAMMQAPVLWEHSAAGLCPRA